MMRAHLFRAAAAAAVVTYATATMYPTAGVVTAAGPEVAEVRLYTGPEGNIVTISNADADYMPGDVVALLMHDNATPEAADDVPVIARYIGWIDEAGVMH